jgi:hypothetical protein
MGLNNEGWGINPLSFAEQKQILVFPSSTSVASEIPLYLKFNCVEYSQNGLLRAGAIVNAGGYGNVKAMIAVPMPSKLTTQTAMRYKQEDNPNVHQIGNELIGEALEKAKAAALARALAVAGSSKAASVLANLLPGGLQSAQQFSQLIDSDFHETILQSGSKRSFQVQLYMPCLNADDSKKAAEIVRAFEALSLPTTLGESIAGSAFGFQFFFHPPMWFISAGSLDSIKNDIDWTSQPQASVLTNIAVTRTAIDASSFTALDITIKPVAYSVTLNFVEIEAAVRTSRPVPGGATSFNIRNRSGANLGLQTAAVGLITG